MLNAAHAIRSAHSGVSARASVAPFDWAQGRLYGALIVANALTA